MNTSLAFFAEIFQRFFSKSPTFFKVVSWITFICSIITGIPTLLTYYGVNLSPFFVSLEHKSIAIASLTAALISQLTVANPATTSLPFTEKTTIATTKP